MRYHAILKGFFIQYVFIAGLSLPACAFEHPGLSNTRRELEFIREMVRQKKEPWYSGLKKIQEGTSLTFKAKPPSHMNTPTGGAKHASTLNLIDNSNAAYCNTLYWWCTGEEKYAKKAIELLNAWSYGNKSWSGSSTIWTALAPFYGHCAAEILRHCSGLWPEKDVKQYEHWISRVIYPNIGKRLADGRNSSSNNWQAWMNAANIAIAVFTDDEQKFKSAIEDYKYFLPRNIFPDGKNYETCRDMVHTQMGVGGNIYLCLMAEKHGVDMWGYLDNRLLKGTEYNIPFLISNAGPAPNPGCGVKKSGPHPCANYEAAWDYYHNRTGLSCPTLAKMISTNRPSFNTLTHADIGTAASWKNTGIGGMKLRHAASSNPMPRSLLYYQKNMRVFSCTNMRVFSCTGSLLDIRDIRGRTSASPPKSID